MSFFDDASLAFLPSGAAGKDGKAYSIKPVPEYGAELVTNGDFATDSDWTKPTGWTISNGNANADTTAYKTLAQPIPIVLGKKYKVSYDIVSYTSGSVSMTIGADSGALRSAVGSYSEILQYNNFYSSSGPRSGASGFVGSIDNVSVKEVLVADGDFDFSRGSNLAATRVGPTGLIEKGRENLLLQSNQFDSVSWSGLSKTSGILGYDGTNDAWEITKPAQPYTSISQSVSATGVWTFSLYAKANTLDKISIRNQTDGEKADIDLLNGLITYTSSGIVHSDIELISNDWYRLQITFSGSTAQIAIYVAWNNSTAGSVYIQDAQLEVGLAATDYIESGASTGKAGLLEDEPRFDYSGGATCPSLLLEPSRTNLINYSEYFGSGWSLSNISATYNYSISPEGLKNATLMSPTTNDAFLREMSNSFTSGGSYTASIYMKSNSGSSFDLNMRLRESGGGQDLIETKTITTEWQRFEISITATITGNYQFWIGTSGTWSLNEDLLIWGAQLEAGSYPTSYIPNHSGGTITRGDDFATKTGLTSSINSTEGTMFLDFKALANTLTSEYSYFSMTDGTYNNRISIVQSIGANNRVRVFAFVGGTKVFDMNGSVTDITAQTKVALRYAENAFDLFANGVKVSTDTSGAIFPANTLDRVSFSEIGTTLSPFKGEVNQVLVFKEALSDADCITLTT